LPFEARSIYQFAASLDNVVLLVVFLMGVFRWKNRKYKSESENRLFLILFSVGCWTVLALTTANLGISVRQKWMFLPMIFYLLVSVLGRTKPRGAGNAFLAPRQEAPHKL
jgi:CDP-diglyceride synthetase